MKTSIRNLLLLALSIVTQQCAEDWEPARQPVRITFTIDADGAPELPAGSQLLVSLEAGNGQPVMELAEAGFQRSGESFITSALPLLPGNYRITDFMIVNEHDEMLFAAPRETAGSVIRDGSDMNFRVMRAPEAFHHDVRLLDVRRYQPADLGYHAFRVIRRFANIMVTTRGSHKPVSASAAFLHGGDTVSTHELKPKMNRVPLPPPAAGSDSLVVWKDGYAPEKYAIAQVQQHAPRPLRVILEPALTMRAYIDALASLTFTIDIAGTSGSAITVDWGDGGSPQSFDLGPAFSLTHDYSGGGSYPVTITGDLEQVTYFYSAYGQGMFDALNVDHLTALKEIRIALTLSPQVLDLSHNTRLETVLLAGLGNLARVHFPATHYIDYLTLVGPCDMTTEAVDAVIVNVYENTVARNITDGWLWLAADWTQEETDETLLGPPSPRSIELLRAMKETYGWTLSPDPFD